jgi:hypothetical protein
VVHALVEMAMGGSRAAATFTAVRLVCLAGDVASYAPVERCTGACASGSGYWLQSCSHVGWLVACSSCLVRVQHLG